MMSPQDRARMRVRLRALARRTSPQKIAEQRASAARLTSRADQRRSEGKVKLAERLEQAAATWRLEAERHEQALAFVAAEQAADPRAAGGSAEQEG
jgi:hypothetical protein